ncbi:gas vesicle protein [Streptomyces sp. NPDC057697]|uniref:gas vesicle protein n=1 Tax=Streptomyces sp. NPDC057697 TaxID=3346219 RepID=UPI0036897665
MRPVAGVPDSSQEPLPERQIALIDLLDRLLSGGVVLTGDVVLSIADIDLVRISLRALIVSISEQNPSPWHVLPAPAGEGHDP